MPTINIELPLNWELSKNRKFVGRTKKVLNPLYVRAKDDIAWLVRKEINQGGLIFLKKKVWVRMIVWKTLRGDCHNLIEGALDAIKNQIGVDDNLFSVSCDWTLCKDKKLFIQISQE